MAAAVQLGRLLRRPLASRRPARTRRPLPCGQNIATIRWSTRWKGLIEDEADDAPRCPAYAPRVGRGIVARADRGHPYEVPCVIALPVVAANPDYAPVDPRRDNVVTVDTSR